MTEKFRWVIVIMVIIIIIVIAGGYLYKTRGQMLNPLAGSAPTPKPTATIETATWKDPMGFTFNYPKNMVLNPHDEDKDNYAHLELVEKSSASSTGSAGSIIVWVKDNPYESLSDWLAHDKSVAGASALDTTWAGQPAKKMIVAGEPKSGGRIVTAAIYDDLLWLLDGVPGKNTKFNQTYDGLLTSFKFYTLRQLSPPASQGETLQGGDESGGDEEVVE